MGGISSTNEWIEKTLGTTLFLIDISLTFAINYLIKTKVSIFLMECI